MKTYILNSHVLYRTEDGVLMRITENNEVVDEVNLTITANRILTMLIESQGQVLDRNNLLAKIWEENGLTHSNNTLTQYICLLRKILKQYLELDNIIRTVPKIGYVFDNGVEVKIAPPPVINNTIAKPKIPITSLIKPHPRTFQPFIFISTITLLIGTIAMVYLYKKNNQVKFSYTLNKTIPYKQCEQYVLSKHGERDIKNYTPSTMKAVYEKLSTSCKDGRVIISYFQGGIRSQGTGVVFFANCFVDPRNKKLESCQSYNYVVK